MNWPRTGASLRGRIGNSWTYAYDLAGNRLTKTHDAGSDGTLDTTTHSIYGEIDAAGTLTTPNADDRLRWTITTDAAGAELSRTEYRYDANGSTTFTQTTTNGTAGDVHEMFYDLRGRLSEADLSDGAGTYTSQTTYAHDAAGLVVRSLDDLAGGDVGHTSSYLTDTNNPTGHPQVLEEHHHDDAADPQEADWINSSEIGLSILAQAGSGPLTYYLTDGHGSTRATADYQGTITGTQDYDAAGNALNFAPTDTPARPFYAGQMFDNVLNEHLMGARYYNPRTGRFSILDLIGNSFAPGDFDNTNLYTYVHNDPVNFVDPTGHEGLLSVLGTISMGIGLLAYVGMASRSIYHHFIVPAPRIDPRDAPAAHKALALVADDTYSQTAVGTPN
jgi:RHS repeat-associated protein